MVAKHTGHSVVHLFVVSFGEGVVDEEDEEDEDEDRGRVDLKDPWWRDRTSDDEDLFDVDLDDIDSGARPSNTKPNSQEEEQDGDERGVEEGEDDIGDEHDNDEGEGDRGDEHGNDEGEGEDDRSDHHGNDGGDAGVNGGEGGNSSHNLKTSCDGDDDDDDDDDNSEMARSDILESPVISDEDCETHSAGAVDFHAMDLVDPVIKLEMKFTNIQMFREAMRVYNVKRGNDVKFTKNETMRCVAVCRDAKCNYKVYGRKMPDEESFQEKWRVDVNLSMIYRARRKAKQRLYGNLEDQYGRLWDYCETLRHTNSGSCVVMKVDRPNLILPPKFGRLYVCLAAMKKGFLEGCRPIIGVDGCFIKGPFKGQLLSAVGRDGNNNMYPIAFAVVEAEVKDSWIWFLETLVSDLGTHARHARPTFISDRQKGLMPAFEVVMPMVDHRICVRHLYSNFRDIGGHRGLALKEQLWSTASSYTEYELNDHMEELKKMNEAAYEYLSQIDPSTWSRAWFSDYPKCDLLVNNICECVNSNILKARDKPILTMFEMIRKKLMRRYQAKREGIEKLTEKLIPRIASKLEEIGLQAVDCIAQYAGDSMFEVTCPDNRQYVVDLGRRRCGCRQWEITRIPCPHAVAAVLYDCGDPEDYV
ncbi:uncharacterized protein LOC132171372 [Corylus avellana]|uniref:uncharacterized protein LOC132171372 n=1 Tax=Corylus avellana TaxID=13451 RepID=UPI00286C7F30|nr:uncharacterized protein LOC132171372 [Corylus avellana]